MSGHVRAISAFLQETKNDLFHFRKTAVDPVFSQTLGTMKAIDAITDTAGRTSALMSLKSGLNDALAGVYKKQEIKANATAILMMGTMIFAPVMMGLAGFLVAGLGVPLYARFAGNHDRLEADHKAVNNAINERLIELAQEDPAGFFSSAEVQREIVGKGVLSSVFRTQARLHKDYLAIKARVRPRALTA